MYSSPKGGLSRPRSSRSAEGAGTRAGLPVSEAEHATAPATDRAAVAAAARTHDPDRYLAALFAPEAERGDLWTLAAFGAELQRIPLLVSETMMGRIRLQWWRDAIEGGGSEGRTGNPVADALRDVMRRRSLPEGLVHAMIDGRASELDDEALPDEQSFRAYLGKVAGAPFALAARVLGSAHTAEAERAMAAAGHAYGLARLLATLTQYRARGRLPLPRDRIERFDLSPRDLLHAEPPAAYAALVAELAASARDSARQAVALSASLGRPLSTALLPFALTGLTLDAALRADARSSPAINPLTRLWRLWRAHRRGFAA